MPSAGPIERREESGSSRPLPSAAGAGWRTVAGTLVGQIVGSGAVKIFAFAVMLKPTADATGLSRQTIGLAFLVGNSAAMLVTPFYGRIVDRFGIRRVSIAGALLWAASTAAFAVLDRANRGLIFPLYVASGVFSVAQTPLSYAKAISSWFDEHRGLALGIGMSGVGLGGILIPQYVSYLLAGYGWRAAYGGIGLAIAALAVPAFAFLVSVRPLSRAEPDAVPEARHDRSIVRECAVSRVFWTLAAAFLLLATAAQGVVGHLPAMLSDRGVDGGAAARALSLLGGTIIAGRLASGYLLDRLPGPLIAGMFNLLAAVGCALLILHPAQPLILAAAALVGLGIGAEYDVLGYLVGRYFGLASYGAVFGALAALVTLGTSAGPFAFGAAAASLGYGPALGAAALVLVASAALVVTLGPYPAPQVAE